MNEENLHCVNEFDVDKVFVMSLNRKNCKSFVQGDSRVSPGPVPVFLLYF